MAQHFNKMPINLKFILIFTVFIILVIERAKCGLLGLDVLTGSSEDKEEGSDEVFTENSMGRKKLGSKLKPRDKKKPGGVLRGVKSLLGGTDKELGNVGQDLTNELTGKSKKNKQGPKSTLSKILSGTNSTKDLDLKVDPSELPLDVKPSISEDLKSTTKELDSLKLNNGVKVVKDKKTEKLTKLLKNNKILEEEVSTLDSDEITSTEKHIEEVLSTDADEPKKKSKVTTKAVLAETKTEESIDQHLAEISKQGNPKDIVKEISDELERRENVKPVKRRLGPKFNQAKKEKITSKPKQSTEPKSSEAPKGRKFGPINKPALG